jgi:hypothetical protein
MVVTGREKVMLAIHPSTFSVIGNLKLAWNLSPQSCVTVSVPGTHPSPVILGIGIAVKINMKFKTLTL